MPDDDDLLATGLLSIDAAEKSPVQTIASVQAEIDQWEGLADAATGIERADACAHLGRSLFQRYELTRDPRSLQVAVRTLDQSLNERSSTQTWARRYLAASLVRQFEDLGDVDSLHKSIAHFKLIQATEPSSTNDWWVCSNLARAQYLWYDCVHERSALVTARDNYQKALESERPAPNISGIKLHYSRCLIRDFDDNGTTASLGTAWRQLESAAQASSGRLYVLIMIELGSVQLKTYQISGQVSLLDQAITSYDEALKGQVRVDYPLVLTNMGSALRARFQRTQRVADLDRSIELLQLAVGITPRTSAAVPFRTLTLASSLIERHRAFTPEAPSEDLSKAIADLRIAASICRVDDPIRPNLLSKLSEALLLPQGGEDVGMLRNEEAVHALRMACREANSAEAGRPKLLLDLARLLISGNPLKADYFEARRCASEALFMIRENEPAYYDSLQIFEALGDKARYEREISKAPANIDNIIVSILPTSSEKASTLSTAALLLQKYLRSLDADHVRMADDREPPPDVPASKVPQTGTLIVVIDDGSSIKLAAFLGVLQGWASVRGRNILLNIEGGGEKLAIQVNPDEHSVPVAIDVRSGERN